MSKFPQSWTLTTVYQYRSFNSKKNPFFSIESDKKVFRSKPILDLYPLQVRDRNWNIFCVEIFKSCGAFIRILIQKIVILYHWKYHTEALKNLSVIFNEVLWWYIKFGDILWEKEKQDSNGSKGISDLSCTKSSSSDDRLPGSYSSSDF